MNQLSTTQTLRPYQAAAVTAAQAFEAESRGKLQQRKLFTAPCGTGKGTIQIATLNAFRAQGLDAWIVTPSIEIIKGFLERVGEDVSGSSEAVARRAYDLGITTGTRLANRMADGRTSAPDVVLVDEVHQWVGANTTPEQLWAMAPMARWIGYTATPYRASIKGTQALLEAWGEPVRLITIAEAVDAGYIVLPTFRLAPLVDDDALTIRGGDITPTSSAKAYTDELDSLAQLCADSYAARIPTCVSVSNATIAKRLARQLNATGTPARVVLQETPGAERTAVYAEVQEGAAILIQIRVLSVGADLPRLRRLIDCQPTLSPVLWLQTVGRVMRSAPGKTSENTEVLVTNRNLERHAYLLEGLVPGAVVAESQDEFDGPSARAGGGRVLGFERLGKFKQLRARLAAGGFVTFYSLYAQTPGASHKWRELTIMFLPWGETITATRQTSPGNWGRWELTHLPAEMAGFATSKRRQSISSKQRAWWERSAGRFGLVAEDAADLSPREFQILPVLSDLKRKLYEPRQAAGNRAELRAFRADPQDPEAAARLRAATERAESAATASGRPAPTGDTRSPEAARGGLVEGSDALDF